ncbi:2(OG)-Fe(II) oxygenase superfamily protein [Nitzschia inconspicua]|uniref:2(OG)-Fe(II) oxygenase superfamily protein n=1 Tax=Nitzschia inconspicua TaxID=303405 RepID=A0A9K3LM74_9STRA|nr:2(OG)-Fe(II) oxygenase superfamily protein [Nitzschia inconspicua]
MHYSICTLLWVSALLAVVVQSSIGSSSRTLSASNRKKNEPKKIEIINQSGRTLVVDWIHPETGKTTTLHNGVVTGQSTTFNSFVNHTLALHESSQHCDANADSDGNCPVRYITINEKDRQVAHIGRGMTIDEEQETSSSSFTTRCREQASTQLSNGTDPLRVMEELQDCLRVRATILFQRKNDEVALEARARLTISATLENYTCADPNRELSEPVDIRQWTHSNVTRDVLIMHDRPSSQIHVLQDFISAEECEAIQAAAEPKLHRGTVANGSGGHKLSESRKAWQAGVRVPWELETQGNPIAKVVRRLYDYANDAVAYNLTVEGQEDLMSIQYFGVGEGSTEPPDQYRPHCDGSCDGLSHKTGGRVATMVMYCDVPELGGATNFQNSNVFVKPKKYAAAFFSYYDIETGNMETGFTSHSGCPVIKGTKRIAVHWMRIGVDKENSWDTFNTLTIKKADEEDC